ncbi:unnamed protein product [Phytophthora lilii]|uniref:Unnamed protein product n=1 Tax=Phytophthora lilii TaxID=2077276 RepID=A0A9W6WR11_9STRA|nr:unnamed protein product [Phytophthora lilii]
MSASSQGDIEDEERRALEQELAAELAVLSAEDVGLGNGLAGDDDQSNGSNGKSEMDYVRLDLDMVLQQIANDELQIFRTRGSTTNECGSDRGTSSEVASSAFRLLLQSVERSDREFFQLYHEDLNEIRTSFLDATASASLSNEQELKEIGEVRAHEANYNLSELGRNSCEAVVSGILDDDNGAGKRVEEHTTAEPIQLINESHANLSADLTHSNSDLAERRPVPTNISELAMDISSWAEDHQNSTTRRQQSSTNDQAVQREFEEIAKRHEARESRRLKTQARCQKERDDATALLRQLQIELEAEEKQADAARREADEQLAMSIEEVWCRLYDAAMCKNQEIALMTLADQDSMFLRAEIVREQTQINAEIVNMTTADLAEQQRILNERQVQHQKQMALAQFHFGAVLVELVRHHEIQDRIRDQQKRRELRECVQMRAEEASMRRVLAEIRVLRDQQNRERDCTSMILEDKLASAVESLERAQRMRVKEQLLEEVCRDCMELEESRTRSAWMRIDDLDRIQRRNEERCRTAMEQEEDRCRCAWKYLVELAQADARERERLLDIRRQRILANVSAGFQTLDSVIKQHKLVMCLKAWKLAHAQSVEENWMRAIVADKAAKRIQIWHRSCQQRHQQFASVESLLVLEDISDDEEQPQVENDGGASTIKTTDCTVFVDSVNQEAALRLQSTFRGFHVRRKYANALALAHVVDEGNESFEAVDLDDLIELPPELEDGWENPVLPASAVLAQRYSPLKRQYSNYEDKFSQHIDNNREENYEMDDECLHDCSPITEADRTPKERNLAATLWNKIKRVKQRQQHAQLERNRQQDPVYRVQKLLNRKTNVGYASQHRHTSSNNQDSNSYSQNPQGGQKVVNMVSWSSPSNTKKKPKVKLPSLVERLRKQTMAER